jgi:hypothetical protein
MKSLLTTIYKGGAGAALLLALAAPAAHAQTDLLGQLEQTTQKDEPTQLVEATFKATRLINGHTVQTPGEGTMVFLISHRFGSLNSGAYQFFGLDAATLRLGFEYGLTDRLQVGIGRSSFDKTFDGFVKYKALQQSTGAHAVPVTVTLLGTAALSTFRYTDGYARTTLDRTAYTYQALIARKFSTDFSLQLMPTIVHRNMVVSELGEQNDIYALGVGGRYKLTRRFSLNGEYYARLRGFNRNLYYNSVALGVDIETGGHIFQLHVTNSSGMIEKQFITETTGNILDGGLFFGFNMSRNFTIKQRHRK